MSQPKGISKQMIAEAAERLRPVITETKLIHSDVFSREFSNQVYIKPENLQKTGAFKIRGAYNKIAQLDEASKAHGVIASSAGNHAQGVAYAAREIGCDATIVMPTATPLIKVNATKSLGAEVVLYGDCYDEAYEKALEIQAEKKQTFIHPFNDIDVIAGQATIGSEILEELPDADYVLVPVGGGGLISGIAYAVKQLNPNCKVFGVEPEGAMSMKTSMESGHIVRLDNIHTIADGVAVKEVGNLTFEFNQNYVDGIIAVNDYDIMESFLMLIEKHKIVAENAGALTIAALKNFKVKDKKIVCVLSGGNIDVVTVSAMINKGLSSRGRIFCFSVELPDTPGQLLRISQVLADLKANVIKLDHNQFMNLDRFMHVQLQVTVETNGHDHIQHLTDSLNDIGYQVHRVY